ncbi:MAG: cytochrome P460 family protein [Acidobacteriia bacterium]|nr:cytochrome P460 family protein [Terriglobia bacterium]
MLRFSFLLCLTALLMAQDTPKTAPNNSTAPVYTADGRLVFPANYREWIYLTTGMDMDYNPDIAMAGHSMFDNVFVNPEAYKAFVATGTWPDKTMVVLEGRMATSKGSINKAGHYQTNDVMMRSVHVKDESRFPGKWAFFGYDEGKPSKQIPKEAVCYSCHEQHGAVDTTFVQFYPTLLEIAKKKGTLAPGYLKEETATAVEGSEKKSN